MFSWLNNVSNVFLQVTAVRVVTVMLTHACRVQRESTSPTSGPLPVWSVGMVTPLSIQAVWVRTTVYVSMAMACMRVLTPTFITGVIFVPCGVQAGGLKVCVSPTGRTHEFMFTIFWSWLGFGRYLAETVTMAMLFGMFVAFNFVGVHRQKSWVLFHNLFRIFMFTTNGVYLIRFFEVSTSNYYLSSFHFSMKWLHPGFAVCEISL